MQKRPEILLINSKENVIIRKRGEMPPSGILLLATLLEKEEFGIKVMDLNNPESDYQFLMNYLNMIRTIKVVGISCLTLSYLNAIRVADLIKCKYPEIIVVIGGPHTTFQDKEALETNCIDVVVRNEGEETFLELCNYYIHNIGELKNIKGITYKNNQNEIIINERRFGIKNLDSIPFPRRDFINLSLYNRPFNISTSRGCPGSCIFCGANNMSGKDIRMRSPDNVIKEIEYLKETYHAKVICIADDTFTIGNKDRLKEIAKYLKKNDLYWACESRVDVKDKSLFEFMAKNNCIQIQIGIESLDQSVLDYNNKKIHIHQIEEVLSLCLRLNVMVVSNIIVGLPNDTREKFLNTLKLLFELTKKYALACNCSICTPFPGTSIFLNPEKYNMKIKTFDWDLYDMTNPIAETEYLTLRDQKELYYQAQNTYNNMLPKWYLQLNYITNYSKELIYHEQRDKIFK